MVAATASSSTNREQPPSTQQQNRTVTGKLSRSGKSVLIGDIRVRLDGGSSSILPTRNVPNVPTENRFEVLPKVRQDSARFKPGWVTPPTRTSSAKPFRANHEKHGNAQEEVNLQRKKVWVTKEEAQRRRKGKGPMLHPSSFISHASPTSMIIE